MSGNLSRSMRDNYDTHGVDEYYKIVGASYRNPHFPGIKQCLNILMNKWWQYEASDQTKTDNSGILICDLACGSGEVTIALQEWWEACRSRAKPSANPVVSPATVQLRPAVSRPAVGRPNPNSSGARPAAPLLAPFPSINLDNPAPRIVAADPYTADAYFTRTGLPCATLSFQDIALAGLPQPSHSRGPPKTEQVDAAPPEEAPKPEPGSEAVPEPARELYDLVICSFALHLVVSPGALFALLSATSYEARWLVVLEPHKKPEIKDGWGWVLWDVPAWKEADVGPGKETDFVKERHVVHCRVYKSINA
ncbi:hypothetical protein BDV93DRAFT_593428 [Ceratobasidium sp. AG-I]|nr:hypothetical protein BDV93DRAFT_593428 [Ceratobasidium sp. AG-I]